MLLIVELNLVRVLLDVPTRNPTYVLILLLYATTYAFILLLYSTYVLILVLHVLYTSLDAPSSTFFCCCFISFCYFFISFGVVTRFFTPLQAYYMVLDTSLDAPSATCSCLKKLLRFKKLALLGCALGERRLLEDSACFVVSPSSGISFWCPASKKYIVVL